MARRFRPEPPSPTPQVRCAIYTRKSTEEGLEQEFNSLDVQREAAEAFIKSQRHEGWVALPDRYDDGGYSGGNTERPALQRLLADVEEGQVDCVVVYKVDRLSRSLMDFTKLVEVFDRNEVSFVGVTQQFNRATSMGRLTLNILLSFAQFEREIISERIRDKVGAAKRKGKFIGGRLILGYDLAPGGGKLLVNEEEAEIVRLMFERFTRLGSELRLAEELNTEGIRTKSWITKKGTVTGGKPWNRCSVYRVLRHRHYLGEVEFQGEVYAGEHDAIVPRPLWENVQKILAIDPTARANRTRSKTPALLRGVIRCDHCGSAMHPTFTRKRGKTYRYYACTRASKNGYERCPVRTVAAGEIEGAVVGQLRGLFGTPEIVARTFREARTGEARELERLRDEETRLAGQVENLKAKATRILESSGGNGNGGTALSRELRRAGDQIDAAKERLSAVAAERRSLDVAPLDEREVTDALGQLDPIWDELFPAEQTRVVQLLVENVEVHPDGLEVRLRSDGLGSVVTELGARGEEAAD